MIESPSSVRPESGSGATAAPRPGARPQRPGQKGRPVGQEAPVSTGRPDGGPGEPLDELIAGLAVDVPDYPEPGVLFRDLTPGVRRRAGVPADGRGARRAVGVRPAGGRRGRRPAGTRFDVVVGVEARGFLLAAAVALDTGVGVVPVRKAGKLPRERIAADYALEYGTATLELHADSIRPGARVLVVDDVLATGGTLEAAIALVERLGGVVAGGLGGHRARRTRWPAADRAARRARALDHLTEGDAAPSAAAPDGAPG